MPPKCSRRDILQSASENRRWSAVPKPLDNSKGFKDSQHRYWRLCFYEFEKDMICSHDYGSIKPVIRQLKMLEELHDALHNGKIEFYWDNNYNLLEKIGPVEMGNMECRLNNVLKSIRKNIKNDDYAIAKYVLTKNELDILIHSEHVPEPEPELELENLNQWNCVIV
ncbi:PREDICTED: uncharacterized protein LOC108756873 [Trachymyrmex septentrionalis]|uniref:uncharacterized protein LOC108756873 n=1 Tax=Trachymyrmex septentrionalis TaxID=34720 RepID=UPI00084EED4E|nr:PREDICTED: uncharacterized protein LOC108756873 [Trachymyrmex septentrionalis]